MKKIIFALVVLMLASPAWAEMLITCANSVVDGNNIITISYDATSEPCYVRAVALDVNISGDVTISDVNCLSKNFGYHIYLGDIDIDSEGTVQSWGSCKCDGAYPETLDDVNKMTLEAASLYKKNPPDAEPPPDKEGDLASFIINGHDTVCITVTENSIRGGTVMEDPCEGIDVNLPPALCVDLPPSECMMATHPDYANWTTHGKPPCWCYRRQCRGDIDGLDEGPFSVSLNDVIILRPCYNQFPLPADCECADLDHLVEGPFWVSLNDVVIIRQYYNQMPVAECDDTHINFWTN